jgi:DNA end-binding protein Ku
LARRLPHCLADYHDTYTEQFKELIEAKVEGREVVAPPEEEVPVINLMDALRRSLRETGDGAPSKKRRGARPRHAAVARRHRKSS